MNRTYTLISIKRCQFFLFLQIFFLSFTTSADPSQERKKFVCGYKAVVEYMNSLIIRDRDITLHQIEQLQRREITEEEVIELIMTLMRYRLLPINEKQGKCRFFSYLCIQNDPTDETDTLLYDLAVQRLQNNPHGLDNCHIYSSGREKVFSLFSSDCKNAIVKRISAVPAPLATAQAGLESAWGNSRFSVQGHNLFGMQTTFSSTQKTKNHPKCIPARRNPRRCLYKFNSIETSFFIYTLLLNTYPSYISFREQRYQTELAEMPPCDASLEMAKGLNKYAEDPNYIKKIQGTIKKVCQIINDC
ncbi:MAG: glucosaminidase domain-containing protein [Bdellovibrionales bacterium]|nr:glucosaminidase domain-containing protein [Bdellovibrionales bacterium]